jgi:hypothetical protein
LAGQGVPLRGGIIALDPLPLQQLTLLPAGNDRGALVHRRPGLDNPSRLSPELF